eukprot:scaffold715_cov192-Alexandrium_tamarense.AAC.18
MGKGWRQNAHGNQYCVYRAAQPLTSSLPNLPTQQQLACHPTLLLQRQLNYRALHYHSVTSNT